MQAQRTKKRPRVVYTCGYCGVEFTAKASTPRKFCGYSCARHSKALPLTERFWSAVQICAEVDCWEWQLFRDKRNYGRVGIARGKSPQLTHRVAWELANGPIPDGLLVCHSCDNPPCCNPAHLFLGTDQDNVDDMRRKGRGAFGERSGGSKVTAEQVLEIRRLSTA
ncbi:MAG TPA: HNH endonuclease signature motif containing protein, partial [Chloroflexota bacterium]|nr:HNH endonuclease signature motif containing protein [Chloroflexota bacterium]